MNRASIYQGSTPVYLEVVSSTEWETGVPAWEYVLRTSFVCFDDTKIAKLAPTASQVTKDFRAFNINEIGNTLTEWFGQASSEFEPGFTFQPAPTGRLVLATLMPGSMVGTNGLPYANGNWTQSDTVAVFNWPNQLGGTC